MRRSARHRLSLVHSRRGAARASRQAEARRVSASTSAEELAPELGGLGEEVGNLFASARRVVWSYVDLVSLETRRAGMTLAWMAAWSGVAALLISSAWLALMGATAFWAVAQGYSWAQVLVTIALLNAVIATGAIFLVVARMSRQLLFPATRRQLARRLAPEQDAGERAAEPGGDQ